MQHITCKTPSAEYDILIGESLFEQVAKDIRNAPKSGLPSASTIAIVSDINVWKHYGHALLTALAMEGFDTPLGHVESAAAPLGRRVIVKVLFSGETIKTRATKAAIEDWLLAHKCHRNTLLFALGGGVVGDMAGFVAATYMRGVPVVQFPTSLLAMVDSSIGGKTGVDCEAGKNLIGAFHHPARVYVDVSVLKTLPRRELSNGFAEIIKAGAIADAALFNLCESRVDDLLGTLIDADIGVAEPCNFDVCTEWFTATNTATTPQKRLHFRDAALLVDVIAASIAVKVRVVSGDEREGGVRAILNFGHTIGHALEAVLQPEYLHGECVAMGMVKEMQAARALGKCSTALINRVRKVCSSFKLPVKIPHHIAMDTAVMDQVMGYMAVDKKNTRTGTSEVVIKCVIVPEIGKVLEPFTHSIPANLAKRLLADAVHVVKPQPSAFAAAGPIVCRVPGSKSLSNRVLLLACLCKGVTKLSGLLASDDTSVMVASLSALGADIKLNAAGDEAIVTGTGGAFRLPPNGTRLYVQNAGTASRFLTAVLALLPTSAAHTLDLYGNARMHERPIGPLVDALRAQGAHIECIGTEGFPPLRFCGGISAEYDTSRGHRIVKLAAKLSSQYVSAILMAAPLFPGKTTEFIEVALEEDEPTSLPYILMTIATMADFGVNVQQVPGTKNRFMVPLAGSYTPPNSSNFSGTYAIEADASTASYPIAIGTLLGKEVVLPGVGTSSTQGDAGFARLLRGMGCTVAQTADATTVSPPSTGHLSSVEVDMANETDCFMTLAVLAALAKGTTTIRGIANQRVKECDRIAAMVSELSKCGVGAEELADGIVIRGVNFFENPAATTLTPAIVHCYDDHRIAMSMSIISLAYSMTNKAGAIVLDDAACVEKTFPEFWDFMENTFHCVIAPANLPPRRKCRSVFFIGMRGAGKSVLSRVAHQALLLDRGLNVEYCDMDKHIENAYSEACHAPKTIAQMVTEVGWDAFREKEASVLAELANRANSSCLVVSCGGGIVETEANRGVLTTLARNGHIVIEVDRDVRDTEAYLLANGSRPVYPNNETFFDVFSRRQPWYRSCSSHTYSVLPGVTDWNLLCEDLSHWFSGVYGALDCADNAVCVKMPDRSVPTAFMCIAAPTVRSALSATSDTNLEDLGRALHERAHGAGAVELRVDLLDDNTEANILQEISTLRLSQHAAATASALGSGNWMPHAGAYQRQLIYTVRTVREGGKLDNDDVHAYCQLLLTGFRAGCDYIDMELGRINPSEQTHLKQFMKEHNIPAKQVIASAHWPRELPSASAVAEATDRMLDVCGPRGPAYIKLVAAAHSVADIPAWFAAVENAKQRIITQNIPVIAVLMGSEGQITRVLNQHFTPITHPLLPAKAAPGQLSFAEIVHRRVMLGAIQQPLQFALLGCPVHRSPSPAMHNAAFKAWGLPWTYEAVECADATAAQLWMSKTSTFGGASVTIPLKVSMLFVCTAISREAAAIGSVNTLRKRRKDGALFGFNTDWLGILLPLQRRLHAQRDPFSTPLHPSNDVKYGVVIGAGGTAPAACFAMLKLGIQPVVVNPRTPEKAHTFVESFNANVASHFPDLITRSPALAALDLSPEGLASSGVKHTTSIACIVSTVPPDAHPDIPASLVAHHPVVYDVTYLPRVSPLRHACRDCPFISGDEMLITQALFQLAIWARSDTPDIADKVMDTAAHTDKGPLVFDAGLIDVKGVPFDAMAQAAYAFLDGIEQPPPSSMS